MATRLIRGIQQINPFLEGCVLAIGNFDGVHLGHQMVLKNAVARANLLNIPCVVMTFEPQPLEFLLPERDVPRLTRFREKFYWLSQLNVDYVCIAQFNEALAGLTADQFIKTLLIDKFCVRELVVGDDFHFGYARQGNVALLQKAGESAGFTVLTQPELTLQESRVSSTRVRKALQAGDHVLANQLLGRSYSMMGRVVHGDKLGRVLGYPTANIHLHRKFSAVMGIYAVRVHGITKNPLPGVANVGTRPTVDGTRSLLEAHLFDFDQTIYGKHVEVEFCHKLRDEERYDSLDLLKKQIDIDALQARAYFEEENNYELI